MGLEQKGRIRRSGSAAWRKIDGQVAVISTDVNRLRLLNGVGGFVWEHCDAATLDELVDAVCEAYPVERQEAYRDVTRFVQDLAQRGLIELDDAPNERPTTHVERDDA